MVEGLIKAAQDQALPIKVMLAALVLVHPHMVLVAVVVPDRLGKQQEVLVGVMGAMVLPLQLPGLQLLVLAVAAAQRDLEVVAMVGMVVVMALLAKGVEELRHLLIQEVAAVALAPMALRLEGPVVLVL